MVRRGPRLEIRQCGVDRFTFGAVLESTIFFTQQEQSQSGMVQVVNHLQTLFSNHRRDFGGNHRALDADAAV